MDFQRYLLIGAIAVLSYMLLTEWNVFQQRHTTDASASAYAAQQVPAATSLPGDAPAADSATELPVMAELPTTAETAAVAPTATAQSQIVRVYTDVLELQIDRRGGDIVFAALPNFKANLDKPELPFVLLEQNERRTYVAQSGLIGRDGQASWAWTSWRPTTSCAQPSGAGGTRTTSTTTLVRSGRSGSATTSRSRLGRSAST